MSASCFYVNIWAPGRDECMSLEVSPATMTVRDLKAAIGRFAGSTPDTHELCYDGQVMEDGRMLSSYALCEDAAIHLDRMDPVAAAVKLADHERRFRQIAEPYNRPRIARSFHRQRWPTPAPAATAAPQGTASVIAQCTL
jgi:hypothetical protein